MQCPDCNSKLRKFREGVICTKNHKFLICTKIYDIFYDTNTYIDEKLLCPQCSEIGYAYCMCGECGLECKNGHFLTFK